MYRQRTTKVKKNQKPNRSQCHITLLSSPQNLKICIDFSQGMCLEVSLKTGVDSIPLKLLNYPIPFVPFKFLAQYKLKIFPLIKYPIIQFPPNFFRIILQKKNQWENRNMEQSAPKSTDPLTCENLPHLLSSFVELSVSGLFFPKQNLNPNCSNDHVHSHLL